VTREVWTPWVIGVLAIISAVYVAALIAIYRAGGVG
jgi:hypothetical protein